MDNNPDNLACKWQHLHGLFVCKKWPVDGVTNLSV